MRELTTQSDDLWGRYGRPQKEIDQVRLEIKEAELKIRQTESRLVGASHRRSYWIIGSVGTIVAFIRLLDWLRASRTEPRVTP